MPEINDTFIDQCKVSTYQLDKLKDLDLYFKRKAKLKFIYISEKSYQCAFEFNVHVETIMISLSDD
jgi:hypothetical protein